jgi:uncharacterized protein YdeI (YjbR/CyaY-like superfamily)
MDDEEGQIPEDLQTAIDRTPGAAEAFKLLSKEDRHELVAYLDASKDEHHRQARIDMLVKALRR